jgi:hypothetical protein
MQLKSFIDSFSLPNEEVISYHGEMKKCLNIYRHKEDVSFLHLLFYSLGNYIIGQSVDN